MILDIIPAHLKLEKLVVLVIIEQLINKADMTLKAQLKKDIRREGRCNTTKKKTIYNVLILHVISMIDYTTAFIDL